MNKIKDLILIRNYFGEHDKTTFEHFAFAVIDELIEEKRKANPTEAMVRQGETDVLLAETLDDYVTKKEAQNMVSKLFYEITVVGFIKYRWRKYFNDKFSK